MRDTNFLTSTERHVRVRRRRSGWSECELVGALVLLHLAGGKEVEDIRVLQSDYGFCRVMGRLVLSLMQGAAQEGKARFKKLQFHLINIPSQAIRHSRRLVVRIAEHHASLGQDLSAGSGSNPPTLHIPANHATLIQETLMYHTSHMKMIGDGLWGSLRVSSSTFERSMWRSLNPVELVTSLVLHPIFKIWEEILTSGTLGLTIRRIRPQHLVLHAQQGMNGR